MFPTGGGRGGGLNRSIHVITSYDPIPSCILPPHSLCVAFRSLTRSPLCFHQNRLPHLSLSSLSSSSFQHPYRSPAPPLFLATTSFLYLPCFISLLFPPFGKHKKPRHQRARRDSPATPPPCFIIKLQSNRGQRGGTRGCSGDMHI